MVFFFARVAIARGLAFMLTASDQFVMLDASRRSVMTDAGIRMTVDHTICPVAIPWAVVHYHDVRVPREVSRTPSLRTKEGPDANAVAERDCASNDEAGARWGKHGERIVSRDNDKRRIDGLNFNVRATRNDDLSVRTQIAEVLGLLAHALNGVHHIGTLRENGIPEIAGPVHIGSHLIEH